MLRHKIPQLNNMVNKDHIAMLQYYLRLKLVLFFFGGITVLSNITLLVNQNHQSIIQTNSSFECFDAHMPNPPL